MERFQRLFSTGKTNVIGMIHIQALPGTPRNKLSFPEIIDQALKETEIYRENNVVFTYSFVILYDQGGLGMTKNTFRFNIDYGGVAKYHTVVKVEARQGMSKSSEKDGLIVENMHDIPYQHTCKVGPEVTACMAVVCQQIKKLFKSGPVGVQILAGANTQALAVAKAAGLDFIRAEGFVFSHVADEGIMNACAGDLLRFRKQINAEDILIFTDIKKKHSAHAITSDVNIVDTAKAAEFFLSDGVIVTGTHTGQAVNLSEFNDVQQNVNIPVLIGSGVTNENLSQFKSANGLIVGSHFKKDGHWENAIDTTRLRTFMEAVKAVRKNIRL